MFTMLAFLIIILVSRASCEVVEMEESCDVILGVLVDCAKLQNDNVDYEFTRYSDTIQRIIVNRLTGLLDLKNLPAVNRVEVLLGEVNCRQILGNAQLVELQFASGQVLTCFPKTTTEQPSTSKTQVSTTATLQLSVEPSATTTVHPSIIPPDTTLQPSVEPSVSTAHPQITPPDTTEQPTTSDVIAGIVIGLGGLLGLLTHFSIIFIDVIFDIIINRLVQFHDYIIRLVIKLAARGDIHIRRYPQRLRRRPERFQYR